MREIQSDYGRVLVGDLEAIFNYKLKLLEELAGKTEKSYIGLTGGSTPKAFYKWVAEKNAFNAQIKEQIVWSCSDERYVPISSDDSNFGNAERLMLEPLEISTENKLPWLVDEQPKDAASAFNTKWDELGLSKKPFDICFLGMGDDCHTLSIFPSSPLLATDATQENFAAVEVPGKGMRLTLTVAGLHRCDRVVICATGAGKIDALHRVLREDYDLTGKPVQMMKPIEEKVTWLIDEAAAEKL